MSVVHHLDQATVVRYASGDLDEAFSVIVASHLAMCSTCRKAVRAAEELGGCLLDKQDDAPMSDDLFDRLMDGIVSDPTSPDVDVRPAARSVDGDVPLPLRRYVGPSLDGVRWKRAAPGIRRHRIDLGGRTGSSLYMLHIAPGMALPEHGHGGNEMTLILSGAYNDMFGRFGSGDIADLDEDVEHKPIVEDGAACVCLVATEAPTRFKDVVSRLLQPIVGI